MGEALGKGRWGPHSSRMFGHELSLGRNDMKRKAMDFSSLQNHIPPCPWEVRVYPQGLRSQVYPHALFSDTPLPLRGGGCSFLSKNILSFICRGRPLTWPPRKKELPSGPINSATIACILNISITADLMFLSDINSGSVQVIGQVQEIHALQRCRRDLCTNASVGISKKHDNNTIHIAEYSC